MNNVLEKVIDSLVSSVIKMPEIRSVGINIGSPAAAASGDGVDIYVFCDSIPCMEDRYAAMCGHGLRNIRPNAFKGDAANGCGTRDSAAYDSATVNVTYFVSQEIAAFVDTVAKGERFAEENGVWPTARLAAIRSLRVIHDREGFLAGLKQKLDVYPQPLAGKILDRYKKVIGGGEELALAASSGDVIFYHSALDAALEAFLQVIFVMNGQYFPGRRAASLCMEDFKLKPDRCGARLVRVVGLGASAASLADSYKLWRELARELSALCGEG